MRYRFSLHKLGTWLVITGLMLSRSASVFAQSEATDAEQPAVCLDATNSPFGWALDAPSDPFEPKLDSVVADPVEEDKAVETAATQAFLPLVQTGSAVDVSAAAIAAPTTWSTIKFESFEVSWPVSPWQTSDYNGSGCGGNTTWNDTSQKAFTGNWSAHPTGGGPYGNNVHSVMQYGPFSLAGASLAKLTFKYWLASEVRLDQFTYGYSCDNGSSWVLITRTGSTNNAWLTETVNFLGNCMGQSKVFVKFVFTSDPSVTGQGVYVDDVLIQKFQL